MPEGTRPTEEKGKEEKTEPQPERSKKEPRRPSKFLALLPVAPAFLLVAGVFGHEVIQQPPEAMRNVALAQAQQVVEAHLDSLRKEIDAKDREIEAWGMKITELEEELTDSEERVRELEGEVAQITREKEEIQVELLSYTLKDARASRTAEQTRKNPEPEIIRPSAESEEAIDAVLAKPEPPLSAPSLAFKNEHDATWTYIVKGPGGYREEFTLAPGASHSLGRMHQGKYGVYAKMYKIHRHWKYKESVVMEAQGDDRVVVIDGRGAFRVIP